VSPSGLETDTGSDVPGGGFVWADVLAPDDGSIEHLVRRFRLPKEIWEDLRGRTMMPKVAPYPGGIEIVIHDLDEQGHLLELDLCVGPDHVISVHGPLTDGVDPTLALAPTEAERASL
jgi:Mg2+ and Co2+ transporter CorA